MKKIWIYHISYDIATVTSRILQTTSYSGAWLTIRPLSSTLHDVRVLGHQGDGFSWDGCSPKWQWFQLVFGAPDGIPIAPGLPITGRASALHDALYQEHSRHHLPRDVCDGIFYDELVAAGFFWARLYYMSVRVFGKLAWNKYTTSME